MKNILFVYNNSLDGSYGGSQRTAKALYGLSLFAEIEKYSCIKKSNQIRTLLRNLFLFSGNLSLHDCKEIVKLISEKKYDAVYFDVSLHGRLVKKIKTKFPKLKVIVSYHNFEEKFFYDSYRQNGILHYPVYKAAVYNERLSSRYADFNIFISAEDLSNVKPMNKSIVIPATLKDYYTEFPFIGEHYLLFIGSATGPNIDAAMIIIEKIAPCVGIKCVIAGSGMDKIFTSYDEKQVAVIGYVKDFSTLLSGAVAFISPLYYGSGSKIKIAEALMFGKKVLATGDSFNGYDMSGLVYSVCNTPGDFINEIKRLDLNKKFYEENRLRFLEKYSDENLNTYYKQVFEFIEVGDCK
ncbi:MAG: glycosyltransferase [Treponemataceae bacterium]|nr:glycosyltransferase [Treponemataceae bacterium]